MPVQAGVTLPEEQQLPPLPNDVYCVQIADIEYEKKPSPFKNEDGSAQADTEQYKLKLAVTDVGQYLDRWVTCWVKASLRASTKSKRPTLPQFLFAVTGQNFGPDDRAKITADFMNSLIGSELRVTTVCEKSKDGSKEYAVVTSFLPIKKA